MSKKAISLTELFTLSAVPATRHNSGKQEYSTSYLVHRGSGSSIAVALTDAYGGVLWWATTSGTCDDPEGSLWQGRRW